jgi:hypothetical protein
VNETNCEPLELVLELFEQERRRKPDKMKITIFKGK